MLAKPYKYRHTYNCIIENSRHTSVFRYDLHSDWPSGKNKKNITELKKRISIAMIGFKVKNAYHIKSKMIAQIFIINKQRSIL